MIRALAIAVLAFAPSAGAADYVRLPGGELRSVLPPDGKSAPARVAPFELRTTPVTNGEFQAFLAKRPEWRRGQAPAVFADSSYLADWTTDGRYGAMRADQPVTAVSWFAAAAFCESEQARLPTWHEWELAAAADETRADARDDPRWRERILAWYARPSGAALPAAGRGPKNHYGVHDLHGLVWEWVEDFAGLMISADNRNQGDPELLKFCGAGALSTADKENYAVLMRIAMLSSLDAKQSTRNLGFRCARDVREPTP